MSGRGKSAASMALIDAAHRILLEIQPVGGVNYPGGPATIILAGGRRGNLLMVSVSWLGF